MTKKTPAPKPAEHGEPVPEPKATPPETPQRMRQVELFEGFGPDLQGGQPCSPR